MSQERIIRPGGNNYPTISNIFNSRSKSGEENACGDQMCPQRREKQLTFSWGENVAQTHKHSQDI